MKTFLFLINYYNDVDHTAPLMKELLEQGHGVSVVCLTQYKLTTDLRIKQLANYRGFRIHRFALLPRNTGTSNQKTGAIGLFQKIVREVLFNLITTIIFLQIFGKSYGFTIPTF